MERTVARPSKRRRSSGARSVVNVFSGQNLPTSCSSLWAWPPFSWYFGDLTTEDIDNASRATIRDDSIEHPPLLPQHYRLRWLEEDATALVVPGAKRQVPAPVSTSCPSRSKTTDACFRSSLRLPTPDSKEEKSQDVPKRRASVKKSDSSCLQKEASLAGACVPFYSADDARNKECKGPTIPEHSQNNLDHRNIDGPKRHANFSGQERCENKRLANTAPATQVIEKEGDTANKESPIGLQLPSSNRDSSIGAFWIPASSRNQEEMQSAKLPSSEPDVPDHCHSKEPESAAGPMDIDTKCKGNNAGKACTSQQVVCATHAHSPLPKPTCTNFALPSPSLSTSISVPPSGPPSPLDVSSDHLCETPVEKLPAPCVTSSSALPTVSIRATPDHSMVPSQSQELDNMAAAGMPYKSPQMQQLVVQVNCPHQPGLMASVGYLVPFNADLVQAGSIDNCSLEKLMSDPHRSVYMTDFLLSFRDSSKEFLSFADDEDTRDDLGSELARLSSWLRHSDDQSKELRKEAVAAATENMKDQMRLASLLDEEREIVARLEELEKPKASVVAKRPLSPVRDQIVDVPDTGNGEAKSRQRSSSRRDSVVSDTVSRRASRRSESSSQRRRQNARVQPQRQKVDQGISPGCESQLTGSSFGESRSRSGRRIIASQRFAMSSLRQEIIAKRESAQSKTRESVRQKLFVPSHKVMIRQFPLDSPSVKLRLRPADVLRGYISRASNSEELKTVLSKLAVREQDQGATNKLPFTEHEDTSTAVPDSGTCVETELESGRADEALANSSEVNGMASSQHTVPGTRFSVVEEASGKSQAHAEGGTTSPIRGTQVLRPDNTEGEVKNSGRTITRSVGSEQKPVCVERCNDKPTIVAKNTIHKIVEDAATNSVKDTEDFNAEDYKRTCLEDVAVAANREHAEPVLEQDISASGRMPSPVSPLQAYVRSGTFENKDDSHVGNTSPK